MNETETNVPAKKRRTRRNFARDYATVIQFCEISILALEGLNLANNEFVNGQKAAFTAIVQMTERKK